jgi:hypothetical protein
MQNRKRFIGELRKLTKKRDLGFKYETLVPSREIDPKTASKIGKALGLE